VDGDDVGLEHLEEGVSDGLHEVLVLRLLLLERQIVLRHPLVLQQVQQLDIHLLLMDLGESPVLAVFAPLGLLDEELLELDLVGEGGVDVADGQLRRVQTLKVLIGCAVYRLSIDHCDGAVAEVEQVLVAGLDVGALPGQREEQLLQGLSDVELQRVLRTQQHQTFIEEECFPAEEDGSDIKDIHQDLDGLGAFMGDLVKCILLDHNRLIQKVQVVYCVEGGRREGLQEGEVADHVCVGDELVGVGVAHQDGLWGPDELKQGQQDLPEHIMVLGLSLNAESHRKVLLLDSIRLLLRIIQVVVRVLFLVNQLILGVVPGLVGNVIGQIVLHLRLTLGKGVPVQLHPLGQNPTKL